MGKNAAGRVLGIGRKPKAKGGFIGFAVYRKIFRGFGGTADEQDQQAGGHGIQRAGVTDAARAEKTAGKPHRIMGGDTCGLIQKKHPAWFVLRHILSFQMRISESGSLGTICTPFSR